uniref:Gsg1-like 2a n=1 Tax=Neogobius melanostomus TaxID=47308 RepID=A0A8C6U445_9GOBI
MRLERGRRASVALALNLLALALAMSAVTTSYWCEGTRKVAKPFCTGPAPKVKQWYCIRFNSSNVNDSRLVQYIFETGEEKFLMRKFHTGIFFSCEQAADMNGFECRDFSEIAPEQGRGVLWLCVVAESLYLSLLFAGGLLMTLEQCPCFSLINKLKLSAFAALCTAASGLCGMVAHMMFTTVYQLAVVMGPRTGDPRPGTTAGPTCNLAWSSFGTCMASAVTALNRYTKTIVEFKYKRRNIAKSLLVKQKLLDLGLDLPQHIFCGCVLQRVSPLAAHIQGRIYAGAYRAKPRGPKNAYLVRVVKLVPLSLQTPSHVRLYQMTLYPRLNQD